MDCRAARPAERDVRLRAGDAERFRDQSAARSGSERASRRHSAALEQVIALPRRTGSSPSCVSRESGSSTRANGSERISVSSSQTARRSPSPPRRYSTGDVPDTRIGREQLVIFLRADEHDLGMRETPLRRREEHARHRDLRPERHAREHENAVRLAYRGPHLPDSLVAGHQHRRRIALAGIRDRLREQAGVNVAQRGLETVGRGPPRGFRTGALPHGSSTSERGSSLADIPARQRSEDLLRQVFTRSTCQSESPVSAGGLRAPSCGR